MSTTSIKDALKRALPFIEAKEHELEARYDASKDGGHYDAYATARDIREHCEKALAACPRCGEVNPAEIHTCAPQPSSEPSAEEIMGAVGTAFYLAQPSAEPDRITMTAAAFELHNQQIRDAAQEWLLVHANKLKAQNKQMLEALKMARKMVGHPDNIALIDIYRDKVEKDEALLRHALDALKYHREQTRPVWMSCVVIKELTERLEGKP